MMFRLIRQLFGGLLLACALIAPAYAIPDTFSVASAPERQCFANVRTPAIYETRTERFQVHPSYEQKRMIPPILEHRRLRIQTKDAEITHLTHAPVYETVYEQIETAPERTILIHNPAEYASWTETIEVEPAKLIWKQCKTKFGPRKVRSVANTTGQRGARYKRAMCRVKISSTVRTVQHTKMVRPAWTEEKILPAQYKTVARQVVKRPAFAQKAVRSPEYTPIAVSHEIVPARIEQYRVLATYADRQRDVLVEGDKLVRAEVLCDEYATRALVAQMQAALVEKGYVISVDGIYGPETQGAMERFQRDQGLSRGYMTVETVNALGVSVHQVTQPVRYADKAQTTIKATQRALTDAGYQTAADGLHGPLTQAALERFQVANSLEVGYLSSETMNALNIVARI